MKKFLVFALVLVSACVLFADNIGNTDETTDDLKLTVSVGEDSSSKWAVRSKTAVSADHKSIDVIWNDMGKYGENGEYDSAALSNGNIYSVYPSVKTNINKQVIMTVSGEALHVDGVDTKIIVKAEGVGADSDYNSAEWASTAEEESVADTIVWTEDEEAVKEGNRIISQELKITMNSDSYDKALASNKYEAILKLAVTVNA